MNPSAPLDASAPYRSFGPRRAPARLTAAVSRANMVAMALPERQCSDLTTRGSRGVVADPTGIFWG